MLFKNVAIIAGTSITMNKLRTVIRFYIEGKSKRFISDYLRLFLIL
jgi:hypothetical protein